MFSHTGAPERHQSSLSPLRPPFLFSHINLSVFFGSPPTPTPRRHLSAITPPPPLPPATNEVIHL